MSVVILSFNHLELTRKCVNSALHHFSENIILVHNGSELKTADTLKKEFPKLRHLILENNQGFTGGANWGINLAFANGADLVFFLTNDTEVKSFDLNQKDLGDLPYLLAPRIEKRKTSVTDSLGGAIDLKQGKLRHLKSEGKIPKGFYVPGAAFLVSQKAWEMAGPFDESLGTYWEDVDLSLRAHDQGVSLGVIPSIVITHGVGKTCQSNPLYTVYHYQRNRRRVTWRHADRGQRVGFSGVYATDMTRKFFKYALRKDMNRVKLLLRAVFS